MDGVKFLFELIYTNYITLLTIIALGIGIYKKTKDFLLKSKEEQKKLLYSKSDRLVALIREGILDMVITAEKQYGEKTGKVKQSSVYNMIVEKYPDIVKYIEDNVLTQEYIEYCIEDGVEIMNTMLESNSVLKGSILNIDKSHTTH